MRFVLNFYEAKEEGKQEGKQEDEEEEGRKGNNLVKFVSKVKEKNRRQIITKKLKTTSEVSKM